MSYKLLFIYFDFGYRWSIISNSTPLSVIFSPLPRAGVARRTEVVMGEEGQVGEKVV